MKRTKFFTGFLLALLWLSLSGTALADRDSEHGRMMGGQEAPQKEADLRTVDELRQEIKALRQRVAALEALKPTFTNFMPNFPTRTMSPFLATPSVTLSSLMKTPLAPPSSWTARAFP